MGDHRRFKEFAKCIYVHFPPLKFPNIADIAGGKGDLNLALSASGYDVTTFDKRKEHSKCQYRRKLFSKETVVHNEFDLLVGMHPDEATDVIVTTVIEYKLPFAIVPCCIHPVCIPFNEHSVYRNWIKHLERYAKEKGYRVEEIILRIKGRRIALLGYPPKV